MYVCMCILYKKYGIRTRTHVFCFYYDFNNLQLGANCSMSSRHTRTVRVVVRVEICDISL